MNLPGAEKLPALFANPQAPRLMRTFWRVIGADVLDGPASVLPDHDRASVESSLARWINASRELPDVPAVPLVLLVGRFAQVLPSIIRRIAVSVIKRLRPFASLHHPDQTMGGELSGVYENADVSVSARCACAFSRMVTIPCVLCIRMLEMMQRPCLPRQNADCWIVRKALMQIIGRWQPFRRHAGISTGAVA